MVSSSDLTHPIGRFLQQAQGDEQPRPWPALLFFLRRVLTSAHINIPVHHTMLVKLRKKFFRVHRCMFACMLSRVHRMKYCLCARRQPCKHRRMFIAMVNQKGGVGKTTLAAHLAMWLTEQGQSVALIDTDEQRSASRWVGQAEPRIQIHFEREADSLIERAQTLVATHDVVVADGPANLSECTRAILLVADVAVIPCGPTVPEMESTKATVRMVRNAISVRGGELPNPMLVLTRMRPMRFRLSREAREAAPALGIPVAQHVLPAREAIADAPGQRLPVWRLGRAAGKATIELTTLLEEIEEYAATTTKCISDTEHGRTAIPRKRSIGARRRAPDGGTA